MSQTPAAAGKAGVRPTLLAVQLVLAAAVVWFAARALAGQWAAVRAQAESLSPSWPRIGASALLVLASYAVLVESWRALVRAWGGRLGYLDAARIWSVSNLARYLPGRVWSIAAMGVMARRAGVSPVAAAGSALLGTLVNLAAGFVVLFLTGREVVAALAPGADAAAAIAPVLGALGLLLLPAAAPAAARLASRLTGRPYDPVPLPRSVLAGVVVANVVAWILYGLAFRWLAGALLPGLSGKWGEYVAVFAASYLAGYLALFAPGGLVVREVSMATALVRLGAADVPNATLVAVASRLWLSVLELTPGLLFLAADALRPAHRPRPDAPV